ncbi:hypothetical protein ONR75_19305 [Rhodopseudomonas sp. P2A-2r]|uniref:hypothetical protein n=1 Tax=Rhodopseudomonas sp. P2A-2r TaxID=2991972 RepID=UPI002234D1A0|nr:hypothetical protein [Rhodopseudomonas sp. P2A-2r]UZE47134.1 hypothetical protein ONR75_19305 [Rhodopseudomonas sp. P2A-2r]
MKKFLGVLFVCLAGIVFTLADGAPLSIVRHRWQEIITESNHAALRPGSVYDILTHFEQDFGFSRPKFKYLFFDTGLGAADPIYPVFQLGYQQSWPQLVKAGFSELNRHIDHFSTGDTPEGCRIQSVYWVRHIDEFPDMYGELRAAGYSLIDISFDYYVKLRPGAQCGKHHAHELSELFDPVKSIYGYAQSFRTFADIPPELLAHYEAKVGVLKLISEKFKTSQDQWASYDDSYSLRHNSMWFYPDGFAPDHGIDTPRTQSGLRFLTQPKHLFFAAEPVLEQRFALGATLGKDGFAQVLKFLNGQPVAGFDPATEPGGDTLNIATQVSPKNFYTSGTTIEPIRDVTADVSDPGHFKLVSVILRPGEPETDVHFAAPQEIPQLRMVYQLMSPRFPGRAYEQLFIHLDFDAVDRLLPAPVRRVAIAEFLHWADALTGVRAAGGSGTDTATADFIRDSIGPRPVQTVAWSSSLTGLWVFGTLSRSYNLDRVLEAVAVVREGVNVGFYSSAFDTPLFRLAADKSVGSRKAELQSVLDDLMPTTYRDPRRHDPEALTFNRMTCAQCHQMAGRDGVHVLLNDGLDRRISTPYKATEYVFRELDRQLRRIPRLDESEPTAISGSVGRTR